MKYIPYMSLAIFYTLGGTTLVYNIKLRRAVISGATIPHTIENKNIWILTSLPIVYIRDRDIPTNNLLVHEHTQIGGAILNARCMTQSLWWAELTTGIEQQQDIITKKGIQQQLARTGLDDIVFTVGKNYNIGTHTQLAGYGLIGFPTKYNITASEVLDPLVGSRFYGMGFGAELSYSFIQSFKRAFVGFIQGRFIHFFNRPWCPILPPHAQIEPGNVTDLFLILRYRERLQIFEIGYNATWLSQQALFTPPIRTNTPTFLRNSLYLNYIYGIANLPGILCPGALGMGINIGRSDALNTRIAAWWCNFTIVF
jgi:hypothetical protein